MHETTMKTQSADTKRAEMLQKSLLRWYHKHKRTLPWRDNPTPYHVWISEIMLQQTQVKTALLFYKRFLRQFPDIETLAHASEQEVLDLWAGLGYYRRAIHLRKAARQIVREHGSFPEKFNDILALPGVGRYTAGAICSIAWNQPTPVVDGNIRRVLTRLNGLKIPPAPNYFWDQMSAYIPTKKASSFNQAMMELGALVCVPSHPRCPQCPIRNLCKARSLGIQDNLPMARMKRPVKKVQILTLLIEQNGRILLSSLPQLPFIPGKWGLPSRHIPDRKSVKETASLFCRRILGRTIPLEPFAQIRHSISHYRIQAYAFCGKPGFPVAIPKGITDYIWSSPPQNKIRLLSSLFHKILQKYDGLQQDENIRPIGSGLNSNRRAGRSKPHL
jgi:A/G-specific adenine glycosylase